MIFLHNLIPIFFSFSNRSSFLLVLYNHSFININYLPMSSSSSTIHPFHPVKDYEIRLASKLVKDAYPASANVHFVQIDRVDP